MLFTSTRAMTGMLNAPDQLPQTGARRILSGSYFSGTISPLSENLQKLLCGSRVHVVGDQRSGDWVGSGSDISSPSGPAEFRQKRYYSLG